MLHVHEFVTGQRFLVFLALLHLVFLSLSHDVVEQLQAVLLYYILYFSLSHDVVEQLQAVSHDRGSRDCLRCMRIIEFPVKRYPDN